MSYIVPSEFATKMVDAGESKIYKPAMSFFIQHHIFWLQVTVAVACVVNIFYG